MEPNGRDKLSTTWRWMDQKENVFYQNWFIVMKSKRFHSSVFIFGFCGGGGGEKYIYIDS